MWGYNESSYHILENILNHHGDLGYKLHESKSFLPKIKIEKVDHHYY